MSEENFANNPLRHLQKTLQKEPMPMKLSKSFEINMIKMLYLQKNPKISLIIVNPHINKKISTKLSGKK